MCAKFRENRRKTVGGDWSRELKKFDDKHPDITVTYMYYAKTRGQSNLTKSASQGPIPWLGVTPGGESCTIEFLG